MNDNQLTGIGGSGLGPTQAAESPAKQPSHGSAQRVGGGADRVSLSNLAAQLHGQEAESPAREAYLKGLEAAVAAGRYHPDEDRLSATLIEGALGDPGE